MATVKLVGSCGIVGPDGPMVPGDTTDDVEFGKWLVARGRGVWVDAAPVDSGVLATVDAKPAQKRTR